MLLLRAYDLKDYELLGAPPMDGDKFDIVAKIPPGATNEQVNVMIRNLLVERFGLAVHRETRELPVYELVVAKGGLKMKEVEKPDGLPAPRTGSLLSQMSQGKDGFPELPHGIRPLYALPMSGGLRVSARAVTMAALLTMLKNQIGGPVVDRTGLTGAYDFDLFYAIEGFRAAAIPVAGAEPTSGQAADPGDSPPTLRAAFESQLGLKLVPAKGPVEVLVVDHMNKKPTEN
jgi:uncharacterized protein (TIGR03435 family)